MGRTCISYTKGRQHSTFYLWHQRSKQTYLKSTISYTKYPRSLVETWSIPLWNHTWSKYGILPHELTLKQELDRFDYLKVKKKVNRSQRGAPTLLIPWRDMHQKCVDATKCVIRREVLKGYPDFNAPFEIHTDASKLQLGAVVSQKGKPIAFYSRNMNSAQYNYTTTEKELLYIVETLKEFRNILLGHQITVYTDHKNLTYKKFNTERVMRWRLIIKEFGP